MTFFDQVSRVQAGETVGPITLSYDDYPRGEGWSLTCVVIGTTGQLCSVAATSGSGTDDFSLTIPATTTTGWPGCRAAFVIQASKSGAVYVAERGSLRVLPNPTATTAEMTILAALNSVMAGVATDGQQTIALDGIQLRAMSPDELAKWQARYTAIVNAQIGRAGGNGGRYAIKYRTPQDNRYAAPWYGAWPVTR